MDSWKIAVDTGGTFTDCVAISPHGNRSLIKVLSSGMLGVSINDIIRPAELVLGLGVTVRKGLFVGYELQIPSLSWCTTILHNTSTNFLIQDEIPYEIANGELAYLTAHEEAPILAARMNWLIISFSRLGPGPDSNISMSLLTAS